MNSKSTAALLLAGLLLVAGLAGQAAFAHNFTDDESATFLVKVDAVKVHMTLVGRNLGDAETALHHVEHAMMQLDEDTLAEIKERNERLATEIPAAFEELSAMIEDGEPRSAVASQIRAIGSLLAEAVSVRIDSEHLSDPAVRALYVAGLVDSALHSYEAAYGAESHEHKDPAAEEGGQMSGNIVDRDSYIASKLFTFRAKSMLHMIAGDAESQEDAAAARAGLVDLRDAINSRASWEDVTVIVHTRVHENIGQAFGLDLEGHADGGHKESEDGHVEEGHTG